ncbi:DNA polymerase III subunit beta [Fusobacterium perfoetens]|uniref:DNA polymerase III subunit beta n=1 Tax=Fusobacterium perfoetens TaxID=852 RepID=UPI0004880E58|nr:DNA polymerase III subunit beta [Fusobacterium perfoetens]MCI6152041.1 DNA polymerase III subunit beta [Fusobacterium perfoetens]MDY3238068.1 DNA polymerase III subunit beta [Fusobacterium perfoetens]
MKFRINREKFINILSDFSLILKENPIKPIIAGLKIEATKNNIIFTGTSLESNLIKVVEGKIEEEGIVVVKSQLILEYIKLLDEEEIEIYLKDNSLIVHQAEFIILDDSIYPIIVKEEYNQITTINAKLFCEALEKCKFCAYQTSDNLALNCIKVLFNKESMEFIASDSYRLTYFKTNNNSNEEKEYSIPLDSINSFTKIIKDVDKDMIIGYSSKHLVFIWENTYYSTRTIDLAFPNFRQILDFNSFDKNMEFNTDELKSSLKKVITVAKTSYEAKYGAIFDFKNNLLTIQSHSGKGKISQKVNMIKSGENFKGSLNTKFLLEFLSNISKNTMVEGVNASSMFRITEYDNPNYIYILMPLALKG